MGAAVVSAQDGVQDWFTQPSCNGEPDDSAVPSWRADATNCALLGRCKVGDVNGAVAQDADGNDKINVKADKCGEGEVHDAYTVDDVGWLDPDYTGVEQKGASVPRGWTGATRFPANGEGASCFALEGPPQQPTYKLPMCKMYNENACCAPIHDAETQWAYETLVNVADRCLQYVNEEHFALREFFCIACDPEQHNYMSMSDPGNDDYWGEIRICQSFANRVWKQNGEDYDRCGFMIFTDDPEAEDGHGGAGWPDSKRNIVPYGDVAPDTADDPVLPSKFWVDEDWRGAAVEQFFNNIKPGTYSGQLTV